MTEDLQISVFQPPWQTIRVGRPSIISMKYGGCCNGGGGNGGGDGSGGNRVGVRAVAVAVTVVMGMLMAMVMIMVMVVLVGLLVAADVVDAVAVAVDRWMVRRACQEETDA